MAQSKMHKIESVRGRAMREILAELYQQHDSQSAIAAELGISQPTLSLWLVKLGLREKTVLVERERAS